MSKRDYLLTYDYFEKNESFINYVLLFGFYKIKCYLYFFN